jgi:hypothetical protein
MKRYLLLAFLIWTGTEVSAQIGGISGSKLRSYCVDVVDHHKIEFEPAFYYGQSRRNWNDDSKLEDTFLTSDSINHYSGVAMRFTYGLFDRLEIGISVPMDMKTTYFGAKVVLFQEQKIGFGLIGGLNVPMSEGLYNRGVRTEDNTVQAGFGGVFSYQTSDNFSIDVNLEYDHFLKKPTSTKTGTIYSSLDAGYYVFHHQLQLIGTVSYEYSHVENGFTQERLTTYAGITVETGKSYIIVLSVPFDLYGRNVNKSVGLYMALTLTFG